MKRLFATLLLCLVSLSGQSVTITVEPTLEKNPNQRAPLAAILHVQLSEVADGWVDVLDDYGNEWRLDFNSIDANAQLPIIGMRPDRKHTVIFSVRDKSTGNVVTSNPLSYKTPALPTAFYEFPTINLVKSVPDDMEPGLTFLSVRRRALGRGKWFTEKQRDFSVNWGLIVAVDSKGEVVWYYQHDNRNAGIQRLKNGNILMNLADFTAIEIDMLGNEVNSWHAELRPQGVKDNSIPIADAQSLHHQPYETPQGTFMAFTANQRTFENYYTSEVDPNAPRATQVIMGDEIIEFDKQGNILWSWDTFDYLDPYRIGYNTFLHYWWVRGFPNTLDWTHGNGLIYSAEDDSVIISLRLQDAFIKIDKKTKEIIWILGEHSDWPEHLQSKLLTPVGDNFEWPYHGHNPRITSEGTIILFDNGMMRARPFNSGLEPKDAWSRTVEYRIDEENMTIEQVWASAFSTDEEKCNAWAMSDAHYLPKTKNILEILSFCVPNIDGVSWNDFDDARFVSDFPYTGTVKEFDRKGDNQRRVVFQLELESEFDLWQWEVYGGFRDSLQYPNH